MRLAYLVLLAPCISYAMDPWTKKKTEEFQKLPVVKAKDKISTAIAYDESYDLEILIQLFGAQLSQEEKNKYLLSCYARPYSAPLILALGASANIHNNCRCRSSALSGFPNSCKKSGILHGAAERGNPGVVKALLEYKADVNALDDKQETALMKACRINQINGYRGDKRSIWDYVDTIRYLLEAGANTTLANNAGETALQIAQTEIANLQNREIIVKCLSLNKMP